MLRDAHHPRWRRCRCSKDVQSAFASAPCQRAAERRSLARPPWTHSSSLKDMALHIVASRPDPALVRLPWSTSLAEWSDDFVVPLPRGLSRHIVRIVRLGDRTYAIKETQEEIAFREYRLLRDLQRLGLPAVKPVGVVTGREDDGDEELPCALLTEHLAFSLPYRALFAHGMSAESLPCLIDALGRAAGAAAPGRLLLGRRLAVERAVPAQRRRLRGVPRGRRDRRAAADAVAPDAGVRRRGRLRERLRRAARPPGRRPAQPDRGRARDRRR